MIRLRMADTEENFLVHCRMTCVGGSESGDCSCRGPSECRLTWSPAFHARRMDAGRRMAAGLEKQDVKKVS